MVKIVATQPGLPRTGPCERAAIFGPYARSRRAGQAGSPAARQVETQTGERAWLEGQRVLRPDRASFFDHDAFVFRPLDALAGADRVGAALEDVDHVGVTGDAHAETVREGRRERTTG